MNANDFDRMSLAAGGADEAAGQLPRTRRDVEITEQVYYGKPC